MITQVEYKELDVVKASMQIRSSAIVIAEDTQGTVVNVYADKQTYEVEFVIDSVSYVETVSYQQIKSVDSTK